MKLRTKLAALAFAGLTLTGTALAEGRIMITTYVNDFQFSTGNIGCPKGPWGNAFAVDINNLLDKMQERDMEELFEMIGDYERIHGIHVSSRTRVENFQLMEDKIRTQATGPVDNVGSELCWLVAAFL